MTALNGHAGKSPPVSERRRRLSDSGQGKPVDEGYRQSPNGRRVGQQGAAGGRVTAVRRSAGD